MIDNETQSVPHRPVLLVQTIQIRTNSTYGPWSKIECWWKTHIGLAYVIPYLKTPTLPKQRVRTTPKDRLRQLYPYSTWLTKQNTHGLGARHLISSAKREQPNL